MENGKKDVNIENEENKSENGKWIIGRRRENCGDFF